MEKNSGRERFIAVQEKISMEDYGRREGNLLVIAPHPDDDVLGAGGTMIEAAGQGRGVFSVYITDGRRSPRLEASLSDGEMALRREEEALASLKAVGAVGGFFLRKGSEELEGEAGQAIRKELVEIIGRVNPREVYLPAPYERHRTHQRCTRLAIDALRAAGGTPTLLGYSLWGHFWGGKGRRIRDIGPFIQKKVEAVLAHGSQIAYKNYQQGILGKNNFEAIFWESHEPQKTAFAEIFLDMTELLQKKALTLEDFIRQDVETFIQAFL